MIPCTLQNAITRETLASSLVRAFRLIADATLARQFSGVAEESLLASAIGGANKAGCWSSLMESEKCPPHVERADVFERRGRGGMPGPRPA